MRAVSFKYFFVPLHAINVNLCIKLNKYGKNERRHCGGY